MAKKNQRFVQIEKTTVAGGKVVDVLVDRLTRVQYLTFVGGAGGGMTVLADANGQPLLYTGDLPE